MAEIHYRLRGEVDANTAPRLRAKLRSFIGREGTNLVVDCTHLVFIDSVGVTVLLEAQRRLDAEGRHMSIVNVSGGPRRVFERLGLADLLRPARDGTATDRGRPSVDADHG